MRTAIGTSYFVSKSAAERYYKDYGYDSVERLLEDGSISIGKPVIGPGESLDVIPNEGRYQILCRNIPEVRAVVKSEMDEMLLLTAVEGRIYLPKETLSHYAAIKRRLEVAGGRYNSKGFFAYPVGINAEDVLAALQAGKVVNGKKDSQSFFTPTDIGHVVCRDAGPLEGKRLLEPSAGDGALADIAEAAGADVVVVENYSPNIHALEKKGYDVIAKDFLTVTPEEIGYFDAIVANPPFSRNQDIDHILHMWKFLKPGGRLSAIASRSWLDGSQKKQMQFKQFLEKHKAEIIEIDAGVFKESGTSVATLRIVVQKPALADEIETLAEIVSRPNPSTQAQQLGFSF